MNYGRFFWVVVLIFIIGMLFLAIGNKIWHPQPVYDDRLGFIERPAVLPARAV